MLVDTHCHLDPKYFPDGPEPPLSAAREAGVIGFVCIGVGSAEASQHAVDLAARRSDVVATVGVHPHDANDADDVLEARCRDLLAAPKVVAVGEVGLDYHYEYSPIDVQKSVMRRFIAVAREFEKPLVIHTRSAPRDTLDILREEGARDVGGVIHCFSEDIDFAREALDLGFYLSFSGIVTFKNAKAVQQVAAWAPPDRILVETDSPYLAPVPKRGKPNQPAYVAYTAGHVATLRDVDAETLARQTTENACRCFGPDLARACGLS